jgi:Meckel syndrome type 1 protein
MNDGDEKLRKAYRDLGSVEPSARLDASILDAARHAVAPRRASPPWAMPVSLAAVLVLAVGVTLRMQQEEPGIETSAPTSIAPPPAAETATKAEVPAAAPEAQSEKLEVAARTPGASSGKPQRPAAKAKPPSDADAVKDRSAAMREGAAPQIHEEKKATTERRVDEPSAAAEPKPFADMARQSEAPRITNNVATSPPPAAAASAPVAPPAPAAAPMQAPAPAAPAQRYESQSAAGAVAPQAAPLAKAQVAPPVEQARAKRDARAQSADTMKEVEKSPMDRELERIAQLRRDGRNAEADEALAKFRREHPDYRIPDAMWEQVKPR